MSTVEKVFFGFTLVAVAATIFTSPYSANIFGAGGGAVAKIYEAAKH